MSVLELKNNDYPLPSNLDLLTLLPNDKRLPSQRIFAQAVIQAHETNEDESDPTKNYVVGANKMPYPSRELVAIDCEMCLTDEGHELTRISVIDKNCKLLYDTLVKPKNPITNYLTKYSGITEEMLKDVTTTLEDVQNYLMENIVTAQTIIIGHSLENDLKALKIIHPNVIDTAIIFPHSRGPPSKLSLKSLAKQHLHANIQSDSSGHDSCQDARTCIQLYNLKVKHGPEFGVVQSNQTSIFKYLAENKGIKCSMIDKQSLVYPHCQSLHAPIFSNNDSETHQNIIEEVTVGSSQFIYSQFHNLIEYYRDLSKEEENNNNNDEESEKTPNNNENNDDDDDDDDDMDIVESDDIETVLNRIDNFIKKIYEALPNNTLFLIFTGQVNGGKEYKELTDQKKNLANDWSYEKDQELINIVNKAREGCCFLALKSSDSNTNIKNNE